MIEKIFLLEIVERIVRERIEAKFYCPGASEQNVCGQLRELQKALDNFIETLPPSSITTKNIAIVDWCNQQRQLVLAFPVQALPTSDVLITRFYMRMICEHNDGS